MQSDDTPSGGAPDSDETGDSWSRELISSLGLSPHPEGGHYVEILRTDASVIPTDDRGQRPAMTHIYYLLRDGEQSRFHRVSSDELWHHYDGAALTLSLISPDLKRHVKVRIGPASTGLERCTTVPAGWWQAARSRGSYSLCGCTVAPGFDFADFQMLRDDPKLAARVNAAHPSAADLI